jgi:PiT family inorganic phosphate transporter
MTNNYENSSGKDVNVEVPLYHDNPYRELHLGLIILVILTVLVLAGWTAVNLGVPLKTVLVVAVIIAALVFDYVNGMHDAGNAIATVISTRVLTPAAALAMAAVLNLVGALMFSGVAKNVAEKFADMKHISPDHPLTPAMILCGLLGASCWSYITARMGLPVSTTHSLFGSLAGVFFLGLIPLNIKYISTILLFMVIAPLASFILGWIFMVLIMWLFHNSSPTKVNKSFKVLQLFSSASFALSHGSNDAQKAMGIITLALFSGGFLEKGTTIFHLDQNGIPVEVKIACAVVMALGTGFGGMRVIKTLGDKIIKLTPVQGFAAESVAAATILAVTQMHVPISTTQVISSSILGIGSAKRLSSVRWHVAANIITAWIITVPAAALIGYSLYYIVSHCGLK